MSTTTVIIRPGVQFSPPAGASFLRFEARCRRPIGTNSTYRDPNTQMSMYRAWQAWINGTGPKPSHSRAIHPDLSAHCRGEAFDSDEWTTPGFNTLAAEYGWIRTAADDPTERHHFEYIASRDQHRNDPTRPTKEDTEMSMQQIRRPDGTIYFADELGADHLGDYKSEDIGLGELIGSAQGVFGPPIQLNDRQFDIAVAIANRRWDRKRAQIVADVVKALNS